MKHILFFAFFVLISITSTLLATESKGTPPPIEQITYNAKEYIKRYKYEHFFEGYGSTIFPKGEVQRADSLRDVVVEGNRVRRESNLQTSFIMIQNFNEVAKIIRKLFSKKELKKLRQGDDEQSTVFVTNIIANKNMEIEHCALSYVGNTPDIDSRIIKLQEKIRDAVTLYFPKEIMSMKLSTKGMDARSKQDTLIQKSRIGGLKMSELKELIHIENASIITDENREFFDYYYLGQKITYGGIINGYRGL